MKNLFFTMRTKRKNSLLNNNNKKLKINDNTEDFELGEELGKGSFSKVYLLKNDSSKCIKIYQDYEDYGKFEIKCLKTFNCENIVKFYKDIYIKDKPALILEYCKYDLNYYLQNYEHGDLFTLRFIKDLSNALHYLKIKEIIHLDVKPENILINDLSFKLCDFNSVCKINEKFEHFDLVSLWYRAPEIIFKNINYNYQVDIWAFGCVLYEVITSNVLFYIDSLCKEKLFEKQIKLFGLKDCNDTFINECIIDNKMKEQYYNNEIVPANIDINNFLFNKSKYKELCLKMLKIDYYKRIKIEDIIEEINILE